MQVDANDVIGFEFVRNFAIAYAGDHRREAFSLFHEVFLTDRIVESFADGNIGELDAAARRRGHKKTGKSIRRRKDDVMTLYFFSRSSVACFCKVGRSHFAACARSTGNASSMRSAFSSTSMLPVAL